MRVILHIALSGRAASSKPAILGGAVNGAIGSMQHDAFSGPEGSKSYLIFAQWRVAGRCCSWIAGQ